MFFLSFIFSKATATRLVLLELYQHGLLDLEAHPVRPSDVTVYLFPIMPIMHLVSEFLLKGKELYQRMRSSEGENLSSGDLELLKEQLQLLHHEAANLLNRKGERHR